MAKPKTRPKAKTAKTARVKKFVPQAIGKLSEISVVDSEIERSLKALGQQRKTVVFPLWMENGSIEHSVVDDVFDQISTTVSPTNTDLDVLIHTPGGDIHAAYNLSLLFRQYAKKRLTFIVPRWAKSAGTLLVCSGDQIEMGPISEIGPVDPQITQLNPLEKRLERFSPLHIEATLEMIRNEFSNGNQELANGLLQRLQFPLTLGGIHKSLKISKDYISDLLSSRMLSGSTNVELCSKIAETLVEGYADHGYCIEFNEAKRIGLNVKLINKPDFNIAWHIFRLYNKRSELIELKKRKRLEQLQQQLGSEGDSK